MLLLITYTMSPPDQGAILNVVFNCILYPLLEEFFFRGGVLFYLDQHDVFSRKIYSNIVVSAFFSICHLWYWDASHAVLVFFPSLILGWIFQKSESWLLCAVTHMFFNSIYMYLI